MDLERATHPPSRPGDPLHHRTSDFVAKRVPHRWNLDHGLSCCLEIDWKRAQGRN